MTSQEKLIGKTILDKSGITEFFGGEINVKDIKTLPIYVDKTDWENFKTEIDALEKDPKQIDLYLKAHGLEQVEGLRDYILNNDIEQVNVNELNQTQNNKNIAEQAHGILGVKKAIDAYNESLIKNEDGTRKASEGTKKLTSAISQGNSFLGNYLTGLDGAKAGIFNYGKSLATATVKTFALEAATMALNAATSLGVSFLISAGISALTTFIDNLIVTKEEIKEAGEAARSEIDKINSDFNDLKKGTDDIKLRFANLAQSVDNLGKANQSRGKLSVDDYEEFLDLSNQLADLFPQLKIGYDDNGNAILDLSGNVDTIVSSLENLVKVQQKLANQQVMEKMPDVWKEYKSNLDDYNEKLDEYEEKEKGSRNAFQKLNENSENKTFLETHNYNKRNGGLDESDMSLANALKDLGYEAYQYYMKQDNLDGTYSIKWDLSSLDTSELEKVKDRLKTLSKEYGDEVKLTKNKIDSANADVSSYLNTWLFDNENFKSMDTSKKNLVKDIIFGDSGWITKLPDDVKSGDWDALSDWLETNLLYAIQKIDDVNIKTTLNGVLSNNFTVDSLQTVIEQLTKTEGFSKKNPLIIYLQSKLDDKKSIEEQYNNTLARTKRKLGGYDHDNRGFEVNNNTGNELDSFWGKNVLTKEDIVLWNSVTEGITNAKDAMDAFLNAKNGVGSDSKSFKEAWKAIGTTGDEDADKKALEAKKKLEELAEAGKLTIKTFKDSSIAESFMKQTGLSADEATEKINKLKSSASQLASMKTGISSISSILGEKEENQASKKTRTQGIGADTLAGMPEDVKAQTKEYEHFVEVLGKGTSSMDKCKDAANKLATAYVTSNNFLANLTEGKEGYYTSVLKEMGVENAESIVSKVATANKQKQELRTQALAVATEEMADETSNASEKFVENAEMTKLAKVELGDLVAQEKVFANQDLNTSDKIEELNKLALAYLGVEDAIQISSAMGADSRYWNNPEDYEKAVQKRWNELVKKRTKMLFGNVKIKGEKKKEKDKGKGKGKGKKDKSKSKQTFDWLERRLTRMQNIIDLTASKLQNLFSVDAKNSNLDKQIKQTTKLINQYGVAADRYQKKADKVAAGSKGKKKGKKKTKPLSKSIVKRIQSGELTKKSYSKLIKEYDQDTADRIQQYINWYISCHFA